MRRKRRRGSRRRRTLCWRIVKWISNFLFSKRYFQCMMFKYIIESYFWSCFAQQSLGRASGRRLPVLALPPSTGEPLGTHPSSASGHPPISLRSSQTPSDCPSASPPPVPGDRMSMLLSNSYELDTTKGRFEEIYVSYQTLAELCLLLQAAKTESSKRDWMTFANKIGLSMQQVSICHLHTRRNFNCVIICADRAGKSTQCFVDFIFLSYANILMTWTRLSHVARHGLRKSLTQ